MSRARYLLLSASFLAFYGIARLVDLDLGGFGLALLIAAAVFGIRALVAAPRGGAV